ncbi:hypothetical protein BBJ28_00012081 [Nothophytophthora sp. Chile5]|nr:hypothetical protein BBJ28_00012081 [Nothophytophthora sp. Chile5]
MALTRILLPLAASLALLLQPAVTASGVESVMGIVNTQRSVKLDPSVQHIPLAASQTHLRPPPAQIPSSFDIFIGLSVFRDGFRCAKTIFTGLKRATYPERLFFGVVDQVDQGDDKCLVEYCKLAEAEWPDLGACPYRDHIRVDEHAASESRGPTLARHHQQKLIQQEEFCLQLDGHSIFTNLWDENLLAEWTRIDNEMAVLTTYIHHIHDYVMKENGDNAPPDQLPHICTTMRGSNGLVRNVGASMISGSKIPQLSALWGAGLSFSKCHAERRVPVDSHTLWMFDGEEFLRASRLWTSGYDMYSPSALGSVVYHNYTSVPARFEHITVDAQVRQREKEMGENRFRLLAGIPFEGTVSTVELDTYGFGSARSFQQYLQFSGVTFQKNMNDSDSCDQLHWVPYANATDVERVVGGDWKLHANDVHPTPQQHDALVQDLSDPTTNHDVVDEEADTEALLQAEDDVHNGADTGEGQQRLRQEAVNGEANDKGPTSALAWVFLLAVVAALFVTLSDDSASRAIRRRCRSRAAHNSNELYHELTGELEAFVRDPACRKKPSNLPKLYSNFVRSFQDKLNQIRLVVICTEISTQYDEPAEAQAFMEQLLAQLNAKTAHEAVLLCKMQIAQLKFRRGAEFFAEVKTTVDEDKATVEGLVGAEPVVHAAYYRVACDYYGALGPADKFYKNALMFLAYTQYEEMRAAERFDLAVNISIAALTGDGVFNFGEVLATPILRALEGTDKQWLSDLLHAFNKGDIDRFNEIVGQNSTEFNAQPALVSKQNYVKEKVALLALMVLVFKRPSHERNIAFLEIAEATRLPLEQVEWLVMRALSCKLIKGSIDQVDGIVRVSWVQPRVLDDSQLQELVNRLDDWEKKVNSTLLYVEEQTPELFQ